MISDGEAIERWLARNNSDTGPNDKNFDLELSNYLIEVNAEKMLVFIAGVGRCNLRAMATELLGAGPLEDYLHRYPGHLSGLEKLLKGNATIRKSMEFVNCDVETPSESIELWNRYKTSLLD